MTHRRASTTQYILDNILREVRVMSRLSAHRNVVRMLEVYDSDTLLVIVLEHVVGRTLFDLLIGSQGILVVLIIDLIIK